MIYAVIYMCLLTGSHSCQQIETMVEPRACSVGEFKGMTGVNGSWTPVKVGIKCKK
jgi:hypothetical protein